MGTVAPINIVEIGALVLAGALIRLVSVRSVGGKVPASKRDLEAIKTALGSAGGQVVRANRQLREQPFARLDYEGYGRLYHVTLAVGGVTVRRRVVVREGEPPTILP